MKTKKGVSPIVATILLIMLVVILAIIILLWARGFFKEIITKDIGTGSKKIERICGEVELSTIEFDSGEFGFSNDGNVPVYDYRVLFSEDGKESLTDKASVIDPTKGKVDPGEVEKVDGIIIGSSYDSIKVIPILLGKIKTGEAEEYQCPERNALIVV